MQDSMRFVVKRLLWPLSCVACLLLGLLLGFLFGARPAEIAQDKVLDPEAELETLPPLRTGLTREIAKGMLEQGTIKLWKELTPEGHLAICRLAARRMHPTANESFISARAGNYCLYLDQMAYDLKADKDTIVDLLALFEGYDKATRGAESLFSPRTTGAP